MFILEITSFVTKDDIFKVEIEEKYTFDKKKNLKEYKELFQLLKQEGYVKAHSFSDLVWYLPCPSTFRNIEFHFGVEKYNSFSDSLKSYVLIRRKSGLSTLTIKENLRRLKKVIVSTDGLKDKKTVREYFLKPASAMQIYHECFTLLNYLNFIQIHDIKETVHNIFQGLHRPESENRDLPIIQDVLTFDECLNRYFSEHSIVDTFKWYPILLWWKFTTKIPMRPIEVVSIESNCLEEKEDGTFWITIPRFKLHSTDLDETFWLQPLQIDEQTYKMFREYQLRLKLLGIESSYLIPPLDKINPRMRASRGVNKEIATTYQLRVLLKIFYEEVIEGQYGEYYLSRVRPGDTRHFAIMNLFLQGFNILSITRMAGHSKITTPANYYTHAKHYVTSAVYKLAQRKIEGDIASTMMNGFLGRQDYQVRRAAANLDHENELKKLRKVDYGYCKDILEFPSNCVEDCRVCQKYYLFKPSVNEWEKGLEWLESFSIKQEVDALNTLNLMAMISTKTFNTLKDLKTLNLNENKSLSIELFKYLDHKAIVDARIIEEKLKEKYTDEK